ncbi:MAG: response regulator transcription factor [Pedosphaera parvula]|nr:response regulator transcription factor [Pedosphaera parvula]
MPTKQKSPTAKRRLLIVDDHPIMRQGLAQLINNEPDLVVCCEAATAGEALAAIAGCPPDLVLADLSLPDKGGLELIKDIQALHAGLPVLVLSMHDEAIYAERVLRAGARGYIMKQEGAAKVMAGIRQVLNGQVCVSEKMSARILDIFSGRRTANTRSPVERLTDREFEVFELLGQGKGSRQVAEQLHLSIKTVEVHRANIKQKLQLKTAPELIRYAVRWVETQEPKSLGLAIPASKQ